MQMLIATVLLFSVGAVLYLSDFFVTNPRRGEILLRGPGDEGLPA